MIDDGFELRLAYFCGLAGFTLLKRLADAKDHFKAGVYRCANLCGYKLRRFMKYRAALRVA